MRKEYEKPVLNVISLITEEKITEGEAFEGMEGTPGTTSNMFD